MIVKRNLYLVQDDDVPMYVLASSWDTALAIWREHTRRWAGMKSDEPCEPNGIQMIAPADEVLS